MEHLHLQKFGRIGLPIIIVKMKKILLYLILLISLVSIVSAIPMTYNWDTGKLDFYGLEGTNCSASQFVKNILEDGTFTCDTPSGAGDITDVQGDDIYIYNGSSSGDVVLVLNETKLNNSIDARSLNQTEADLIYLNLSGTNANQNINISPYSLEVENLTGSSADFSGNVSTDSWFNGLFNFTSVSNFFNFNGAELDFNSTDFNNTYDNRYATIGAVENNISINYGINESSGNPIPVLLTDSGIQKWDVSDLISDIWKESGGEVTTVNPNDLFIDGSINATGNMYLEGNASVRDLIVRNGSSITLAGATFENEGYYTSVNTNFLISNENQPTSFLGVYAQNESILGGANLVLRNAQNNSFNIFKTASTHPLFLGDIGMLNENGSIILLMQESNRFGITHYSNVSFDEFGNLVDIEILSEVMTIGNALENFVTDFYRGGIWVNGSITSILDINTSGNINLNDKITFGLDEIIDNLVDGWIRITGNLNVTENVTADNFCINGGPCLGIRNKIKLFKNVDQTVVNGAVWNNLTWENDSFNDGNMFNKTLNNFTLTIQKDAFYSVGYHLRIETGDKKSYETRILLNNELLETACDITIGSKDASSSTLNNYYNIFNFSFGDELILQVKHDDVGSTDVLASNSYFQIIEEYL